MWLGEQIAVETEARTSFYLLPLGLMLGILAVYGADWRPSLSVCLVTAAGLAGLGWARPAAKVPMFAAFVALGAASAAYELQRVDTVIFSGEATVRIDGRVLWRDRDERGRMRYLVAIERTERPTLSRPPQHAEILVTARHAPIEVGQRYRGLVRLRAPSGPALPGGYDFAFGAFFEGLGAYGFALGAPGPTPPDEAAPTLTATERFVRMRLAISDRIRSVIDGPEGAVAAAIISGERSGIPDDVERWLRVTGLSHVLSISGLHMALVAGFAMVLVRCACASVPSVALRLPAKKLAAVVALGVSAFYLALAGLDVATTRSFLMIAIMLTAALFDRAALTLRNVALAAIVIFLTTPHALLTASFQMSFGATAAIVGIYGALTRWHRKRSDGTSERFVVRLLLFFVGIAVTSTVAGIATAPYAAYHFQRMAPFGLVANMLTLPIFSFWIMPLALVAMVAMPFGLDAAPFWLLGKGLTLVFAIARYLAERLPDAPTGLLTNIGLAILTLALLTACFLASRLRLVAIPTALVGLLLVPDRTAPPELLVFEDGREVAIIDADGRLSPLKARPNGFVFGQWERAYPGPADTRATDAKNPAFACETIEESSSAEPESSAAGAPAKGEKVKRAAPRRYCRATTRTGIRVVWTDDYRRLGQACDESDVAIVARVVRLTVCRSAARLVTLRTLRTTGSLSIAREATAGGIAVTSAIRMPSEEWNRHRAAPWPEAWRKPTDGDASATP
ncbi:ComEC/Rec2 family competence protein [Aureimonas leprariae]|nr:ComEC/Rec2 family competence protein [Aureimonas leprariae]